MDSKELELKLATRMQWLGCEMVLSNMENSPFDGEDA